MHTYLNLICIHIQTKLRNFIKKNGGKLNIVGYVRMFRIGLDFRFLFQKQSKLHKK